MRRRIPTPLAARPKCWNSPRIRDNWGTQEFADELLAEGCPSLAGDEESRRWFANSLRVGASPAVAYALNRAFFETDLSDVLPAVHVPTLLLYRSVMEAETMEVAARLPKARTMRVSGTDYFGIFLSPEIADEIERFVGGETAPEVPESVLATVMFTDIVGSTERVAEIGDRAWRDLLAEHHAIVRRELSRFRGQERDTAGDGFFATFDGPARAIRAAEAIVAGVRTIGLEARIGIHVGECEIHDGKVAGLAVAIGARVAAKAGPERSRRLTNRSRPRRGNRHRIHRSRHTRAQRHTRAPGSSSHSLHPNPEPHPCARRVRECPPRTVLRGPGR